MSGYCVLSVKKYHTTSQVHAQQEHNNREIPLPNVDKSMSVFNKELVSTNGLSYNEALRNRLYESECETGERAVRRRDNVIALEIVTTYSHDAEVDVNAWAEANVEWIKQTFGEENIIACTLHMDETTPHIHTEVVPLDEKGHFVSGVIVRILLMPGHVKDACQVVSHLYEKFGNQIWFSLMNQYTPVKSFVKFPELNRKVTNREYNRFIQFALDLGIEQAFIQEGATQQESFIPSFDYEGIDK